MRLTEYLNPPPTGIRGYLSQPDVGGIAALAKSGPAKHADAKPKVDPEYQNPDGTFKGGFAGAVRYFMHVKGYSKDVATKIAGKIAAEKEG